MLSRARLLGRSKGKGQSLVEFALILPVVTVLIMGIIDLTFIIYAHVQVAAAAGEGANVGSRFTLTLGSDDQGEYDKQRLKAVNDAVMRSMGKLSLAGNNFTPLPSPIPPGFTPSPTNDVYVSYPLGASTAIPTRIGTGSSAEEIQVRVKYRQQLFFGFMPGRIITSGKYYYEVSSSARARIQ